MIRPILALLMMLALAACVDEEAPDGRITTDVQPSDYVKISRSACFGACPVFDLTLYGDGRVVFHGVRYTKIQGQHSDRFSTGTFLEAISAMEARGFADLKDNYTRDSCKVWATDHPSVRVEVKSAAITKSLDWYTGCRGIEERAQIDGLVDELERILEVERFIGTSAERRDMRRP